MAWTLASFVCRTDAAMAPATAVGLDRVATLMTSTGSPLGFSDSVWTDQQLRRANGPKAVPSPPTPGTVLLCTKAASP